MPRDGAIVLGDLVSAYCGLIARSVGIGGSTSLIGLLLDKGRTQNFWNGRRVCWSTARGCNRRTRTIRARLGSRISHCSARVQRCRNLGRQKCLSLVTWENDDGLAAR